MSSARGPVCLFARSLPCNPPAAARHQIGLEAEAQRPGEPSVGWPGCVRPNQQTRLYITHNHHPLCSHAFSSPQGGLAEGWPHEHPCCSPVEMTTRPWLIDPRGVRVPGTSSLPPPNTSASCCHTLFSLLYHSVSRWFVGALACHHAL